MSDIVNAYFWRFYPEDSNANWELSALGGLGPVGRRYCGPRDATIFPAIECADGTTLSVQGHFGAYSWPRDDFAERYEQVEIMGPHGLEDAFGAPAEPCGAEAIYGYVSTWRVVAFIEAHGGIKERADG